MKFNVYDDLCRYHFCDRCGFYFYSKVQKYGKYRYGEDSIGNSRCILISYGIHKKLFSKKYENPPAKVLQKITQENYRAYLPEEISDHILEKIINIRLGGK